MTISGMIVNLGLIAGLISAIAIMKYTGLLEILLGAFDWVKYFVSWLMQNKIFAALFFIFLIGFFSAMVTFVIGLNYACSSQNKLLEQNYGIMSGLAMYVSLASTGINSSDQPAYDNLLATYTTPAATHIATSERGLMSVDCINRDPKLMLFGRVDFLNFRYWLLIMLIVGLIGIISAMKQWND